MRRAQSDYPTTHCEVVDTGYTFYDLNDKAKDMLSAEDYKLYGAYKVKNGDIGEVLKIDAGYVAVKFESKTLDKETVVLIDNLGIREHLLPEEAKLLVHFPNRSIIETYLNKEAMEKDIKAKLTGGSIRVDEVIKMFEITGGKDISINLNID